MCRALEPCKETDFSPKNNKTSRESFKEGDEGRSEGSQGTSEKVEWFRCEKMMACPWPIGTQIQDLV